MTLLQAAVFGLVQGLTEFLPISSAAHLRIVSALLGWNDPGAAFTAVIQLAIVVTLFLYFWQDAIRRLPLRCFAACKQGVYLRTMTPGSGG